MAGFGKFSRSDVDMDAVRDLPTGLDKESKMRRRRMFRNADGNGNGILSLAECDGLIRKTLQIEGFRYLQPVINRAFHGARDIKFPVGVHSNDYVDFSEFRYALIYLKFYLETFLIFAGVDHVGAEGKFKDR